MTNILSLSKKFIRNYYLQIILVVFALGLFLLNTILREIEMFENPLEKSSFYNAHKKTAIAFDEMCKKDPYKCDKMCASLDEIETCNTSNSCVWVHEEDGSEKCVAGNHLGATFNPMKYIKTIFKNKELEN